MSDSGLIETLIEAFQCLPGVGRKTAQRMTYHLLERDRTGARRLARALDAAAEQVGHCKRCRNLSESELCALCADPGRDPGLLCIVESPADVAALLQGTGYRGYFFVLMGHLSPLDGIGPEDIGLDVLETRLGDERLEEVVLATNHTVEGEVTAHVIADMARRRGLRVTRIARGVPVGGELEYADASTLAEALQARREY